MKKVLLVIFFLLFAGMALAEESKFNATVTLSIKGQEFILTIEEVRELKDLLDRITPSEAESPNCLGSFMLNSCDIQSQNGLMPLLNTSDRILLPDTNLDARLFKIN